jgi:hypothetical protein
MTTFWLSFADQDKPRSEQFLGVAVFDLDETERRLSAVDIIRHSWKIGVNPGGSVAISEVSDERIKAEHKNKLITDEALLMKLGSKGRAVQACH